MTQAMSRFGHIPKASSQNFGTNAKCYVHTYTSDVKKIADMLEDRRFAMTLSHICGYWHSAAKDIQNMPITLKLNKAQKKIWDVGQEALDNSALR